MDTTDQTLSEELSLLFREDVTVSDVTSQQDGRHSNSGRQHVLLEVGREPATLQTNRFGAQGLASTGT